jgi:sortase (surface protein transpeptidase)
VLLAALTLCGAGGGYAYWAVREGDDDTDSGVIAPPVIPSAPEREPRDPPERQARVRTVDHRPEDAPPVAPRLPRLEIPAIGVRAHAVPLGKTAANRLEVPRNWSVVGWWREGPVPGERGPAVVVGHVDTRTGPAVFYRLRELRAGDAVRFRRRDGSVASFVVERTASHSKDRFPTAEVYGPTDGPELRLITCDGSFDWSRGHYRRNLVVYARER